MVVAILVAIVLWACSFLAAASGYPISGSKHDFIGVPYSHSGQNMVTTGDCSKCHSLHGGPMLPDNRCSMCHLAHRPKRNHPLWAKDNPTSTGWVVWNGGTGQRLDGSQGGDFLSAAEFVASGSGLCLSCHDSGVAGATRDLSSHHPIGKRIPFSSQGWKSSLGEGNSASGSNVEAETGGTVGCTSCHSMHNGDQADNKLRRPGQFCLSCHER